MVLTISGFHDYSQDITMILQHNNNSMVIWEMLFPADGIDFINMTLSDTEVSHS